MLAVFSNGQRSPTVLHLPFSLLLCIEHMLELFDNNLKGSLVLFQVFIFVLMWTLPIFQENILAAIFCCTEQGESLNLLVEGVSTFNCGPYPGQEHSFWWLGSLGSTPLLRQAYYNFMC